MDIIYLDYNCFQRWFDDHSQMRIFLESLACQEVFSMAQRKKVKLVWSFMHLDETVRCPFLERKIEALRLSTLCAIKIGPEDEIYNLALSLSKSGHFSAKDALHVACALQAKSNYFLTCDDKLTNSAGHLKLDMPVINPVEYIMKEVR